MIKNSQILQFYRIMRGQEKIDKQTCSIILLQKTHFTQTSELSRYFIFRNKNKTFIFNFFIFCLTKQHLYSEMHNAHHFLIQDDDSETNFPLSSLPVKFACGYFFDSREDPSTRSQNSEKSKNSSSQQIERKGKNCSNAYLQVMPEKVYHQSAIRKHIKKLQQSYCDHKIDMAYMQAQKLKKLCEKTNHKLLESQKELISKVETEMNDVCYYEKIMKQAGWELKKQKKNLKISSKVEDNTVGVLVEAFIDVQIENFLAVLTQIDLMKQWMPFMESSHLEKIVTRNCRIGHCINDFPFISKRQCFFQGIGYDRMEHNKSVFMYTRSLNTRKDLQQQLQYKVRQTKDAIQLEYKYLIIEYFPDSRNSGTLKLAINVDMKLSIPMFILGPATEGFGVDFYENILRIAKGYKGSKWEKSVEKNPQFFYFVQKRIKQFYQ